MSLFPLFLPLLFLFLPSLFFLLPLSSAFSLPLTDTLTLLCIEHRWSDVEKWFFEAVTPFFHVRAVEREQHDPVYTHPRIDIYELRKKEYV